MRRFGERPDPKQRYVTRPGAYGLIVKGDEALLTMSFEEEPSPQLPGGGIDRGEQPIPALHREVFEETGYRIAVEHRIGAFQRFCYMPEYDMWARKVCSIYLCRPVYQLGVPSEPFHTDLWAPLEMLPELLVDPSQAEFVAGFLGI